MSYVGDPRVLLHSDGTASVPNVGWEPEIWKVLHSGDGGFYAMSDDGYLAVTRYDDGNLRLLRFETRDAAIGALLVDRQ